jgi:alpha-1,6-mannosyltransferase
VPAVRDLRHVRPVGDRASAGACAFTVIPSVVLLLFRGALRPWWGIVLVALATVGIGVLLHLQRRRILQPRHVFVACALAIGVAVVVPPRTSEDLWIYTAYGRTVSAHDANPYERPPSAYPDDVFHDRVGESWRGTRAMYGPVFVGVSAAVTAVAQDSALAVRLGFQLVAAAAVGAVLVLLWRRTRDPSVVALVGLHPAVVVSIVNGAHVDALVGLAVVVAVVAAIDNRLVLATVALAGAVLVKVPAALALIGVVPWMWRRYGPARAIAIASGAAVPSVLLYRGVGGFDTLRRGAELGIVSRSSPWQFVRFSFAPWWPYSPIDIEWERVTTLGTRAVLIVAVIAALRWSGRRTPRAAVGAATLSIAVFGAYFLPWYTFVPLAVVALRPRDLLTAFVVVHAAVLTAVYEFDPDALDVGPHPRALPIVVNLVLPALAAVVFVAVLVRRSKGPPIDVRDQRVERLTVGTAV